jgi:hypothetical protein
MFIGYLFFIFYFTGEKFLNKVINTGNINFTKSEKIATSFFAGIGIWHITLLVLGVGGLFRSDLFLALTGSLLLFSYHEFSNFFIKLRGIDGSLHVSKYQSRWRIVTKKISICIMVTTAILLLIVKGLFPAGGHDYYVHYSQFYKEVILSGSIWPNNVWYHFFYSKGAGAFYLAILLTDFLGPQLVTLCMMIGAMLAMFALLERLVVASSIRYLTVAILFGIYIYTPGPSENMNHGGWGDFEKLHEIQTAIIIFLIYALVKISNCQDNNIDSRVKISAILATTAAVIITPAMTVFYLITYLIIFLKCLIQKRQKEAIAVAQIGISGTLAALGILFFNFYATGLPSDQGLLFFWKIINFDKLDSWGVLPEIIRLHAWHTGASVSAGPLIKKETPQFIANVFRLDLTYFWVMLPVVGFTASISRLYHGKINFMPLNNSVITISIFALSGTMIAIFFGQSQHISFYRFSSFLVPIPILLSIALHKMLWNNLDLSPTQARIRKKRENSILYICVALSLYPVLSLLNSEKSRDIINKSISFAIGKISIESAYINQYSWPGRLSWGGIYPGIRGAVTELPKNARLRSFNIHSYCMLPDCKIETHMSNILGADYLTVLYGSASEAKQALQIGGLNYFFISTELAIQDPLSKSALFNPNSIDKYLGIVWTDGVSALLTWREQNKTTEISPQWLSAYREKVVESKIDLTSIYSTDKSVGLVLMELNKRGSNQDLSQLFWYGGVDNLLPSTKSSP